MNGDESSGTDAPRRVWLLCDLCHGVAHDPDPNGWGEPCDNCAGHGGRWEDVNDG